MVNLVAKLFVSVLISNWLYSEVNLFIPGFDRFAKKVVGVVKIPTHDSWSEIAHAAGARQLEGQLKSTFNVPGAKMVGYVTGANDNHLTSLWDRAGIFKIFIGSEPDKSYLSDRAIFASGHKLPHQYSILESPI